MFAPDGAIVVQAGPPVRGRAAIEQFLDRFKQFHVLSERMTTDVVEVRGQEASSRGTYWQRVRLPGRSVVEVHGRCRIEWVRAADGTWWIETISTTPEQ